MITGKTPHRNLTPADNLLAWIAGDRDARYPESVTQSVLYFIFQWSLYLEPEDRRRFIHPAVPKALGTNRPDQYEHAARLATNWLLHINAPAWLELASMETHRPGPPGLPGGPQRTLPGQAPPRPGASPAPSSQGCLASDGTQRP